MAVGNDVSGRTTLMDVVRTMGWHVLQVNDEEDFLRGLAQVLLEHVGCDAVILRQVDEHIQTRAVATRSGVQLLPPGSVWEPFTEADRQMWLGVSDTTFCPDVSTSEFIKPRFRKHAMESGIRAGVMAPLLRDEEVCGQIVFGWAETPELDKADMQHLRGLADVACLHMKSFELRMAKHRDPLTGLMNRLGLEDYWESAGGWPNGAVFFMDLDGFKALNDARGHLGGDAYLRRVARILSAVTPSDGAACRMGGDEFVLLAPHVERDEAARLADEIEQQFQRLGEEIPPPRPSIAIGMSLFPADGSDLETLLNRADERMYEHKRRRAALTLIADARAQNVPWAEGVFESWMETWPDGILVTDPDQKVIYVNRAYERMTGYSLREWFGKTPGFVASGKTSPRIYKAMWESMNTVGAWTGQVINRRRDGTEWVSFLSMTRIVSPDGTLVGYLANARDISKTLWAGKLSIRGPFQEAFTQESLAFALAEAGQMHEGGSRRHLERIRDFTRLLVLGAADRNYDMLQRYETRSAIILSSILHDIGKLAIPDGLLRKPGKLTAEEYALVKTHTTAGQQLLRSPYLGGDLAAPESEFLLTAITIARSHHERWDGTGYPDGLAGEDIPLPARIVSIADVYDALRSFRSYKRSWTHEETVEYIANGAGTQFDPDLVRIFLDLSDEFEAVSERKQDESPVRSSGQQRGNKAGEAV